MLTNDSDRGWRQSGIAALVLLGLLTAIHYDIVFLGRTLVHSNHYNPLDDRALPDNYGDDLVPAKEWTDRNLSSYANLRDPGATWWQWEPSTAFLLKAIRAREWPFWDPYVAAGAPAMANLIPAFFFPPYMVVVALGASVGLRDAYFLALLWGASFFTYLFLKRHGLGLVASIAGGALVLMGGGLNQNLGSFMGQTACCLPVAVFATAWCLDRPSARRVATLAATYASVALASFPPLLFPLFGIVAIYALTAIVIAPRDTPAPNRARLITAWTTAVVLSLGVVAFYYGPAIVLRQDAPQVALMYSDAAIGRLRLSRILQLFSPTVLGGVQVYLNGPFTVQQAPHLPYVGGVAVLCALLARPDVPRQSRTLWISSSVSAVLILCKLFGVQPIQWLSEVPPFNQIHMVYYFGVPLGFLVAVFAALGIDTLLRARGSLLRACVAVTAVVFAVASLWRLTANAGVLDTPVASYVTRDWTFVATVTVAASVAAVMASVGRRVRFQHALAVACILSMAVAEGLYNNRYPHPRRWDVFAHPVPFMRLLQAEAASGRVFAFGAPYPNANEAFDVSGIDSLMAFNPPRMFDLYRRYARPPNQVFLREATQLPPEGVLDRANVSFIGARKRFANIEQEAIARHYLPRFDDGYTVIYQRATQPRAFYSSEYRVVSRTEALDAIATTPPRELLLEAPPAFPTAPNQNTDPEVRVESSRNSVVMTVDAPRPGLIYVADSYFPGWSAVVNGVPTPIFLANYAFRAIAVPGGPSRVELHYWPRGLTAGLFVTCASLLALCGLVVVGRATEARAAI